MEKKEKFKVGYFEDFQADNSKVIWIAEGAPFEKLFNTKDEAEAYANGLQAIGGRLFDNPIVEHLTLKVK